MYIIYVKKQLQIDCCSTCFKIRQDKIYFINPPNSVLQQEQEHSVKTNDQIEELEKLQPVIRKQ